MDKTTKVYLYAPEREFLLPYIEREVTDMERVATAAEADYTCAILGMDEAAPVDCAVTLRSDVIVGTGMTGMAMEFARRIARGTYCHVKDCDGRISAVHAVDVAKAVRLTLGSRGEYVLTDGVEHSIHDFAEAIAWRINQKRILTCKRRWARWLLGRRMLEYITTDHVLDGSEFASKFDFQPNDVCSYLRTHVYDDESL